MPRLVEFTQRTNGLPQALYINPEHVASLHVIKDDGTGIVFSTGSTYEKAYVNESIQYVAAALQGKPHKPKPRRLKRKG